MPRSRPGRNTPAGEAGLSLIEVLVTTLLLAMVVAALFPVLSIGQQGSDYARRRQTMTQTGRVALDKIVRELRAAESFRTLAAGSIVLTLNYGDGTGAAPTVQYSLNGATNNLEYRWSADYDYREQITVTAPNAVASGYAVALTFNHAAQVTAGKSLANGDDVRVRYWNGTAMVELDRVLDPTSAWNTAATKIWFSLQAAIAATKTDNNYYLYYGNLNDANPPAYGPNVFLDYQDGTAVDGWTSQTPGLSGTTTTSATDGFVFKTPAGAADTGYREITKNVTHGDVEIFWGFQNNITNGNGDQIGVGARLSAAGAGYRVLPGLSNCLCLGTATGWNGAGGALISAMNALGSVTTGTSYYGRFYLVGTTIQAKMWAAGSAEPAWQVTATNSLASSGTLYSQVDSSTPAMDHRHRTMIIRPRVATEPALTLGVEASGARTDALTPLAGPFRSLTVACFDATGASLSCSPATSVKAVQVTLVVMDSAGSVPDLTLTGEALREHP